VSDISNEKIFLKTPSISELHYRQEWMKDPKTMSYNAGYDMDLKGYDKETETIGTHQGCLDFCYDGEALKGR